MNKGEFRKSALIKRDSIPLEDRINNSRIICKKILEQPEFEKAKRILCYVNIKSEVITEELIEKIISKNKIAIVPKVNHELNELELCEITNLTELKKSDWGIPEPEKICESNLDVDLIITPGVAFDKKGNRLGYGKGFFDKLLSKKNETKTIGLGFEIQLYEEIPITENDEKIDQLITEKQVIKF